MRKHTYLVCLSLFVLSMQFAYSQTYQVGDKAEALVNNAWKPVRIVKAVAGKSNVYEVETVVVAKAKQGTIKNTLQVSANNLRMPKQTAVVTNSTTATSEAPKTVDPHLGKYDLYSGIPTMYIGHLELLSGGVYKVALSTDENNYEFGKYKFDAATSNIEWVTGLFKNNSWKGKLVNTEGNSFRIVFNKVTFADSN